MVQQGELDEAITHWSEAIRIDPNFIGVRYNLAIALAKQGKHEQAIAHWLEFLRRKPDNLGALMNIAASYAETKRFDEAIASLEKALGFARKDSNEKLVREITEQMQLYRQKKAQGM